MPEELSHIGSDLTPEAILERTKVRVVNNQEDPLSGVVQMYENGLEVTHRGTGPLILPVICCDCGLSHNIAVKFRQGRLTVTIDKDDKLTSRVREISGVEAPLGGSVVAQALAASCPKAKDA